jgi:uncharacterized membrane protein YdjX (TVP38/TMEM64 family)
MVADALNWIPLESLESLSPGMMSAIAAAIFLLTVSLVAMGVPGVIVPSAVTSSAVLGPLPAILVVVIAAAAGSQLLFVMARRLGRERIHSRFGPRLERFERRFTDYGCWYVLGLRLVGAPHGLISAGSAMMSIRSRSFALATVLGLLPVISISATATHLF